MMATYFDYFRRYSRLKCNCGHDLVHEVWQEWQEGPQEAVTCVCGQVYVADDRGRFEDGDYPPTDARMIAEFNDPEGGSWMTLVGVG